MRRALLLGLLAAGCAPNDGPPTNAQVGEIARDMNRAPKDAAVAPKGFAAGMDRMRR